MLEEASGIQAEGLEPDAVTLGKSIGGGVPIGAYGVTAELAERPAAARLGGSTAAREKVVTRGPLIRNPHEQ